MNPFAELLLRHRSIAPMVAHHRRFRRRSRSARAREPLHPSVARGAAIAGLHRTLPPPGRGAGPGARGRGRAARHADRLGQDAALRAWPCWSRSRRPRVEGAVPLSDQGAGAGSAGRFPRARRRAGGAASPALRDLRRRHSVSRGGARSAPIRPQALITNPDMLHMGSALPPPGLGAVPARPALGRAGRTARLPRDLRRPRAPHPRPAATALRAATARGRGSSPPRPPSGIPAEFAAHAGRP